MSGTFGLAQFEQTIDALNAEGIEVDGGVVRTIVVVNAVNGNKLTIKSDGLAAIKASKAAAVAHANEAATVEAEAASFASRLQKRIDAIVSRLQARIAARKELAAYKANACRAAAERANERVTEVNAVLDLLN